MVSSLSEENLSQIIISQIGFAIQSEKRKNTDHFVISVHSTNRHHYVEQ